VSAAGLDAVTLDAYGTLVELDRPVERLRDALGRLGVAVAEETVAHAFRTEVAYYAEHKGEGRDAASLAGLRRRCSTVFVEAAGAPGLDFADDFAAALVFRPLAGVEPALARLRSLGLTLAVVSNWDCSLAGHLGEIGLDGFAAVVTSAEADAAKPDARIFAPALAALGVPPERVLHVGDQPEDEAGALAAGLRFAPAPLAEAVEAL
jgi:HAD superfamily hydrolase (TIGR01509 family)